MGMRPTVCTQICSNPHISTLSVPDMMMRMIDSNPRESLSAALVIGFPLVGCMFQLPLDLLSTDRHVL